MLEQYKLEGSTLLVEGFNPEKASKVKDTKSIIDEQSWKLVMSSRQNREILQSKCVGLEEVEYKDGEAAEWCAIVKINDLEGYIPLSMLESNEKTMRGLVGQPLAFVVIAINNGKNYFVGSRKQALKQMSDMALRQLRIGEKVIGVVRQVFVSNILVDVGGITTSIPVGEITYEWKDDLRTVYEIGDHIEVKITGINREKREVSASVKALLPDPFETGVTKFKEGGEYLGSISGVAKNGYFINLSKGISGLAPFKNIALDKGDQVLVRFGKVDMEERKINLKIVKKL